MNEILKFPELKIIQEFKMNLQIYTMILIPNQILHERVHVALALGQVIYRAASCQQFS